MSAPRRDFLRGLVTLPMIGGGLSIIGRPIGVAETIDRHALAQYANWLFYERRILCLELGAGDPRESRRYEDSAFVNADRRPDGSRAEGHSPDFHFPRYGRWTDVPKPSTRAALVMSAAGFDWRRVSL